MCVCVLDDSSRVVLEYYPGIEGSDYINASHVDVSMLANSPGCTCSHKLPNIECT